jgi:hypothetical protein
MTRGRHTNTAHLYERAAGDHEYGLPPSEGAHVKYRGDSHDAANLVRAILAHDDQDAITAHDYATRACAESLPARVQSLVERRAAAVRLRQREYHQWRSQTRAYARSMEQSRTHARSRGRDCGLEI